MSDRKKVLITGTMGNLGKKIRCHLEEQGDYDLVLMSRNPKDDTAIIQADLSVYKDEWAAHFTDVDAIVHMAADPSPGATWQSLVRLNMDLLLNTFEAALAYGAKRFIFASSNHTMGGYKDQDEILKPDTPPHPGNPYGATKLMGERIGKNYAERHGLSFISLRIGWTQSGENRPGDHMGDWGKKMWLSNQDYCQVVEKAILAENVSFAVLNAMSDNSGMKWDLSETRRVLGYQPMDNAYAPEWK